MIKRETIRKLANKLRLAGIDKKTGLTIALLLNSPGGAEQLMAWMDKTPEATLEEISNKTGEIHNATKMDEHRNTAS